MKCFIHGAKEAVAACRNCGKGMCSDCSAYSGHTGVCPQCRKKEFEAELTGKYAEEKSLTWGIVGSVLIAMTVIGLPIGAIMAFIRIRKRRAVQDRIVYLQGEIAKLNRALSQGRSLI